MNDDALVAALRAAAAAAEKLQSPARPAAIAEAEQVIGFPVPPLLRRLYLEVSNGGFGPGVLGVRGGFADGTFLDIADLYREGPDPSGKVPAGVVLLHDWGCSMWSMVDFRDPSAPMWGVNNGDVFEEDMLLSGWLTAWLEGRLGFPCPPSERGRPISR